MRKKTRFSSIRVSLVLVVFLAIGDSQAIAGTVDLPRYPSISPDGSEIVFSWRGDLWKVSSEGGTAARLTTHPGDDLRSAWSRDGKRIAFNSNRNGFLNLFVMNADGTGIRQVTKTDQSCVLTGFGVDEDGRENLTFSTTIEGDLYRSPRPYAISVDGGDMKRIHDAFGDHPSVQPGGKAVAFTRGGAKWSRRHYRGADRRNVWLYQRPDETFAQLTEWTGNDGKAKWGDRETLYFLSDRKFKCVNLYRMDVTASKKTVTRLTSFKEDDIRDYDVSADGKTTVLQVWDTLYTLDLRKNDSEPVAISIKAAEDEADNVELKSINRKISEAALSPDGKVMAYVAYGEVYSRHVDDKSPTRRVTNSHAREKQIAWSPNGLKLYFVSDRTGTDSIYSAAVTLTRSEVKENFDSAVNPQEEKECEEAEKEDDEDQDCNNGEGDSEECNEDDGDKKDDDDGEKEEDEDLPKELNPKRWHDAIQFTIEPVVETDCNDQMPSPSPDGKSLAFKRIGDLMILDLVTGKLRTLVSGWHTGIGWSWSPDSALIAYHQADRNFNNDIWILPADGSISPVNITRHPDNDRNPRWSADGKILSFISERRNEEYDVWMVYLDKNLETLTAKEREKYYEDAAKAAKKIKPLKIENPKSDKDADEKENEKNDSDDDPFEELSLHDAYLRLQRVTTLNGNESNSEITPAGDRTIFTGRTDKPGLFSIKWDGKELKRLSDSVSVQHLTLTGDRIVFVSSNRAGTIEPEGGSPTNYDIDDTIRIDLQKQSSQKFLEAARVLGEVFYHPTMKDLDWRALTKKYHALAKNTRTADEFNDIANRFLGELNGSHLGVRARDDRKTSAQAQGRLGTLHERIDTGFKVTGIVPETPAAKGQMAIQPGDIITAIESKPFGPMDTVESFLEGKIGEETLITIERTLNDGEPQTLNLFLTPIDWGREKQLKYNAWRFEKARKVAQWSNGRIGYIHIQAMNQSSLDVFERDLYAAAGNKDGLLIDVRNNGGGSTTDRVLASIMVQPHAYTVPRGADPNMTTGYPQDRLFIQRYSLPINLLCNEKSFSNAEIISHAFKTLKRGTLVGQETNGSVISTGGMTLIDGTTVRLPFRGWYIPDGTDMENHGAVPHLLVPQTPETESANRDEQLKAAVDDLLKRL